MITYFEPMVFIVLLLAMLITNMPRKEAIIYVLVGSAMTIYINLFGSQWADSLVSAFPWLSMGESVWIKAWMIACAQGLIAFLLIARGGWQKGKDKDFFRIMALFMFGTSGALVIYRYDMIVTFDAYTAIYHLLAILQVLTVFYYSNGIKQLTGSIGASLNNLWNGIPSLRG